MNILFITIGHVSKHRGGIDRVTDTLSRAFIAKGHNVYMLSLWKPHQEDKVEAYQYFLPSEDIDSLENIDFLKNLLTRLNVGVVVNQSDCVKILELVVSLNQGIPIVSAIHSDPASLLKGITDTWDKWKYEQGKLRFYLAFPYWWMRKIYQRISRKKYTRYKLGLWYEKNSAVVLLSNRFKPIFKKLAGINCERKLFAIGNPISYADNYQFTQKQKEKIVLFVGRLDFQKRLDRVLKAWSRIKERNGWRMIVLGDGNYRQFYEQMCRQMKLQDISFMGTVDPQPYYRKASILCLSSSHEGFSMIILEAQSNGVIPLAFDSYEAVHDLIDSGKTGYIISAFSISSMSKQLNHIMSDEMLQQRLRANIFEKNKERKFDVNAIADEWINLFNEFRQRG